MALHVKYFCRQVWSFRQGGKILGLYRSGQPAAMWDTVVYNFDGTSTKFLIIREFYTLCWLPEFGVQLKSNILATDNVNNACHPHFHLPVHSSCLLYVTVYGFYIFSTQSTIFEVRYSPVNINSH